MPSSRTAFGTPNIKSTWFVILFQGANIDACVRQGSCAEETAAKYGISREQQDQHAITSYKRSAAAVQVCL
jgi:acetyl-CoA acetyltransferase